jgi:formate hydrogenlyase subunit 3/multisubunit Na+/H+ antiporter MnhD subunit
LAGFPPFPAFFAKWELIMQLAASNGWWWIGLILLGSVFELVYLVRWFNTVFRQEETVPETFHCTWNKRISILLLGASFLVVTALFINYLHFDFMLVILPIIVIAALFILDVLPAVVKNAITIAFIALYAWKIYPMMEGDWLKMMFAAIFLIGGLLTLIPGFSYKGKRMGFYPFAAMTILGLFMLVSATTNLVFFMGWELMALGSFMLILRGKKSEFPAFRYILFSAGGLFILALCNFHSLLRTIPLLSAHFTHISIAFSLYIGFCNQVTPLAAYMDSRCICRTEDDALRLFRCINYAGVLD